MSMLTAQANHLREMAYTVERVKNDAIGKLSLSGSITLATAAMDMRDAADTIAQLRNTCNDLQAENRKLRKLVHDLVMLPSVPAFDCCGCKYEEHHDCMRGCRLVERARDLGIEVDE